MIEFSIVKDTILLRDVASLAVTIAESMPAATLAMRGALIDQQVRYMRRDSPLSKRVLEQFDYNVVADDEFAKWDKGIWSTTDYAPGEIPPNPRSLVRTTIRCTLAEAQAVTSQLGDDHGRGSWGREAFIDLPAISERREITWPLRIGQLAESVERNLNRLTLLGALYERNHDFCAGQVSDDKGNCFIETATGEYIPAASYVARNMKG